MSKVSPRRKRLKEPETKALGLDPNEWRFWDVSDKHLVEHRHHEYLREVFLNKGPLPEWANALPEIRQEAFELIVPANGNRSAELRLAVPYDFPNRPFLALSEGERGELYDLDRPEWAQEPSLNPLVDFDPRLMLELIPPSLVKVRNPLCECGARPQPRLKVQTPEPKAAKWKEEIWGLRETVCEANAQERDFLPDAWGKHFWGEVDRDDWGREGQVVRWAQGLRSGATLACFRIDWDFSDAALKDQFGRWLSERRVEEELRLGRILGKYRTDLKELAHLRLWRALGSYKAVERFLSENKPWSEQAADIVSIKAIEKRSREARRSLLNDFDYHYAT